MSLEERIRFLGIKLPAVPRPIAAYVPGVMVDNLVYVSGQLPFEEGKLLYVGKLGLDLTEKEGYAAARICAINCLAVAAETAGGVDLIERIIKVTGYVNSASGFLEQPAVINGASELFEEVLGSRGVHARAAVGVNELPLNAAVEVEMIVKVIS